MKLSAEIVPTTDRNYNHDEYTVLVDDHRILTVYPLSYKTTNKYFEQLLRSHRPKDPPLIVGVAVHRQPPYYEPWSRRDPKSYDLLQICVASHCLILEVDPINTDAPRLLKTFFSNPAILPVGVNIRSVAKQLTKDSGIEFGKRMIDVNELAVKGLKRDDLYLRRYDIDQIARAVLGNHFDAVRPKKGRVEWYGAAPKRYYDRLTAEKAMYATLDAYLCYRVAEKLLPVVEPDLFNNKKSGAKK